MNRLKQKYQQEVVPKLLKQLNLTNPFAAPKIEKVVINIGVSQDQHQDKALESVAQQLKIITGQQPKITRAKKSIASFKLRAGDPIGLMVTLRSKRMYQFLDKLITIALPRVKDFQGVSQNSFDQSGNYSLGFEEQIIFPEIDYDKIDKVRGLQVTIVTSTNKPKEALLLLKLLGVPFAKEEAK